MTHRVLKNEEVDAIEVKRDYRGFPFVFNPTEETIEALIHSLREARKCIMELEAERDAAFEALRHIIETDPDLTAIQIARSALKRGQKEKHG